MLSRTTGTSSPPIHMHVAELMLDLFRLTSRSRRSAVKARKSIRRTEASRSSIASTSQVTLEQTEQTLRALKRHRKQRHAKLKELTREDEDAPWWGASREEEGTACPVCGRIVPGDTDVVEAHVDACLAHVRILEEEQASSRRRGDADSVVDIDGDDGMRTGVMDGVSLRGAPAHIAMNPCLLL